MRILCHFLYLVSPSINTFTQPIWTTICSKGVACNTYALAIGGGGRRRYRTSRILLNLLGWIAENETLSVYSFRSRRSRQNLPVAGRRMQIGRNRAWQRTRLCDASWSRMEGDLGESELYWKWNEHDTEFLIQQDQATAAIAHRHCRVLPTYRSIFTEFKPAHSRTHACILLAIARSSPLSHSVAYPAQHCWLSLHRQSSVMGVLTPRTHAGIIIFH